MNPDHFEAAILAHNRRVRASCMKRRLLWWVDVALLVATVVLVVAFYGCGAERLVHP